MNEFSGALPAGFLFGAATAADQVEGGNTNREDIALLAGLGLNAFRFSVEWARVEPSTETATQMGYDDYQLTLGPVAVDRQTFARRPKLSAYRLGEIARSGR